VSIRSSVLPGVLRRKYKVEDAPVRVGPMVRTKARKKMIVQLAKPFRYPRALPIKILNAQYDSLCWGEWANGCVGSRRIDMTSLRRRDT
jgi:hypothetical protein